MPRTVYDPKKRAAIVEAATAARKAGKSWNEAFSAAKEQGYTGSLQGIVKLLRGAGKRRGRRRGRRAATVTTLQVKRGPGRPPKVRTEGVGSIEAVIDSLVNQRVQLALDKAIQVLQSAKKS